MESKKQEAIRVAYGEYWDNLSDVAKKCALEKNGYISPIVSGQNGIPRDFITFNDLGFRPKSIAGIENNNGWICIESEEDLPKDSFNYWVVCSNGSIKTLNDFEYYKKYIIPELTITHYQPIVKPQPPIF